MDSHKLSEIKIQRAIALSEKYDYIDEQGLRSIFLSLSHALKNLDKNTLEKKHLEMTINYILNMNFKKYGWIFKAENWKNSIIINKNYLRDIVWRAYSLLY